MNILFESAITDDIKNKYIFLPLDTFYFQSADRVETAYCLIELASIDEMMSMDRYKELHCKLIDNYRKQNWPFCESAVEHLMGQWSGNLDSFYTELLRRVDEFTQIPPDVNWNGMITRP